MTNPGVAVAAARTPHRHRARASRAACGWHGQNRWQGRPDPRARRSGPHEEGGA
ncbi:hypothetical protein ACMT4L_10600 [Deinococcus sp. A31D244]|uniref:hypothetical protein n=1 Tax=Deinococcus sp. A31D244 TaxID=3397675 RepID=UPI0039DF9484